MKLLLLALLLGAGCARTRAAGPRPAGPERRVHDSVPDRIADMPAPVPEADANNQEQRFGIGQAKARRDARPKPTSGCVDVVEGQPPKGNPCPKPTK
jgi:hypothetical protein